MVLHGGNLWTLLEGQSLCPEEVLDFSVDLNPFGPPQELACLLEESCPRIQWYPDPTYRDFRTAVARHWDLDPECVLPGNGSADLIYLIPRMNRAPQAVVVAPTFTEYSHAVLAAGGSVRHWLFKEREGFLAPDPSEMSLSLKGGLLFLCNPNNPTGALWPREGLLEMVRACEENRTVAVVDEAYMDFVEDGLRYSMIPQIQQFQQLIVLRSLTKAFAVPGLRIGYGVASRQMVGQLKRLQPPWTMNGIASFVGSRLVQLEDYLADTRQGLRTFRESLWEGLRQIPVLQPFPSVVNFFLCRIRDPQWDGARLAERLRLRGILIRTCDDFTGLKPGRFIRIAIRGLKENERLLSALREILADGR